MNQTSLFSSFHWPQDLLRADKFYLDYLLPSDQLEACRDNWLADFLRSEFLFPRIVDNDVVFFRSMVREDYKKLFHAVIQASGAPTPVVIEDYKRRRAGNRLNIATSRWMVENQKLYDYIEEPNALKRTMLFIRMCMYSFILSQFTSAVPKLIVFFADMQPIEYLLANYFRQKGVPTVTLQHGLYVDYGNYNTVNSINYLHHCSDYFLSWGPNTSALIRKYHPSSHIVECGKPLVFSAEPPPDGMHGGPEKYIALFLDQKPFHAQNEEMINIVIAYAAQNNLDVRVRFHPSLPKKEILKKYPQMTEQLHFTDALFVIGHTSSLIYEALALGCKAFRYKTDIPAIPLPDKFEFTDLSSLKYCVCAEQSDDLHKEYFCAMGNDALGNYKRFFQNMLSK